MAGDPLEEEANSRLKDARAWKAQWALDLKECYFLAAPHRQRNVLSTTAPPRSRVQDAAEVHTDLPMLLCGDFNTEIVNTYMPEAQIWCERKAGAGVPAEVFSQIAEEVKTSDKAILDAIKASNLYAELPKAFFPDLAAGTTGLWIDQPEGRPITVHAIPIHEMEINLGPYGEIDDRFAIRWTRNCHVAALLGDTIASRVPGEVQKVIEEKPQDRTELRWGFWRLWDRRDDEVWQHVVMVKDKVVHDAEIKGEGCCPFLPMRFNPSADWPFGIGPLMQSLPTFRQVDEWERQVPEAIERAVNSPLTFPDDSFAQIDQGLEPGAAYPIRPGTEGAVKRIFDQPTMEPELVDLERKEHRLKKLFFVDFPEQSGDTPPTLGQWLDEMARAQRRIGTVGQSFWREGPMRIFLRFKYLLEANGSIKKITDKQGRLISTQPYNPAQRAAEQQEIATATQAAQILAQMFPEEWRLVIDGRATMDAFISKMRVSGLLKMRDQKQVAAALDQIKQLIGARQHAGGEAPAEAGAPAAV